MKAKHKSLIHASLEIIAGRVFVAVISLLFIAYFARELPKPILGLIGVHAAVAALSKILLDLGMHFQVVREATPLIDDNRLTDAVDKVIRPAVTIRVIAATAFSVLLFALGYLFIDDLQAAIPGMDMYLALPFACAHILLKNYLYILTPVFFASQRYWQDSLIDSGSATCEKIFAFLFYIAFGIDYFFAGVLVGVAITLLLALWLLRDVAIHFRPRRLPVSEIMQWLRICFPNYQRVLYRSGFRQLDRVVIAAMLPLSQMANYHIARQGAQVLGQLARVLSGPVSVRLAADLDADTRDRDRRLYYTTFIVLPLLMAALSPWLVTLIGGEKYADAWVIMAVLNVAFIFNGLAQYQLSVIAVKGDSHTPIGWERFAGVVGLVTTIAMTWWIGQSGAPLGQLVNFMLLYFLGRSVVRQILANP
ncbi:lipopolysaccharide biosynthesis protein [Pseudomonadota bacterium]